MGMSGHATVDFAPDYILMSSTSDSPGAFYQENRVGPSALRQMAQNCCTCSGGQGSDPTTVAEALFSNLIRFSYAPCRAEILPIYIAIAFVGFRGAVVLFT